MPTKAAATRKAKGRARGQRSGAENHLRRHLASTTGGKRLESEDDDQGLYNWLRNLHSGPDDHRSQWEKDLEERLRKELGVK